MANSTQSRSECTIGLDLGDKTSYFFTVDGEGKRVDSGRVRTTREALRDHFKKLKPALVVIEVGTHSPWVNELLCECSHEVLVANPRQLKAIYGSNRKSDKTDAELLGRLGRMDRTLLCPIKHRGRKARIALSEVRARDEAVKQRTSLVNHLKGAVKQYGERLTGTTVDNLHLKIADLIPKEVLEPLKLLVELLAKATETIKQYDKRIEKRCVEHPETKHVRQIRGVGSLTALAYILILEDPKRFKKSRDVGAYLGLVPRREQSGDQDPQLRITKGGDKYLRVLLVQCAHYILGPFGEDCDLRRHGEKIMLRGGKTAKKRAVIAVARKLSVLMHRLWVTREQYWPLREERAAKEAEREALLEEVRAEQTQRRKKAVAAR